ncbi:Inosose isomerase [Stieleria maiorica]|uniref:Inosose isomerase n=1 Tax=Stieleria maiorica TaxID=2795974 RepID=A0A5B9MET6_9BACT|nr:sugar phosphate isomerase/epimerase family protein [Stieleria maiorica]QEF97707.1 Inosose isomerase [Stieleria maiorica]
MKFTRRDVLAASAGLFSMATCSSAFASTEAKRKFTVDLRWGSIGVKANQNEAIELAAKHGFESVAASPQELEKLSDAQSEALVGTLKEKGLVWGSSGLPVDFRKDDATFKRDLGALPAQAAALRRAGVDRMGTWIRPCHDDLTYVANFKQHADRLRQCAKILKDHGLRLGLEYVGTATLRNSKRFPFIHTMRETAELHSAIGVDNMGFVLDSWHWYTAGETADDIRSLNANQIVGCDLNDAPKDVPVDQQIDNRRELPAATGVIDVKSFLQALIDVGYDGPVRAEPFNQALNQMDNDDACEATSKAIRKAIALVEG